MKILVTGSSGGLGKYIQEYFQCDGFTRESVLPDSYYDAIIHCARNSKKLITSNSVSQYIDDNIFLTQKLSKIPCGNFIYMSSVDIYPSVSEFPWKEDDIFEIETHSHVMDFYTISKIISEQTIVSNTSNFLILRLTALLHKYAQKSSVIKIIEDDNPVIPVTPQSKFNCILASDLVKFLDLAITKQVHGIYNVGSVNSMSVLDMANMFKKNIKCGHFYYCSNNFDTKKICSLYDSFNKTTEQVLSEFTCKN